MVLLVIAFVVLVALSVIGCVLDARFVRKMRSRHPELWQSLGRPTIIPNNSIVNGFAVQRFLWHREYESVDDPGFVQLARVLRTFGITYIVVFAVVLVIFFIAPR